MTLVEIVVVLVLLGLASALAAPAFLPPRPAPGAALQDAIDDARLAAVRRAGAVTLALGADGRWVVEGDAGPAGPLLAGALPAPPAAPLRLRISPLGACTLDPAEGSGPALAVDPIRCRLRAP